MSDPLFTVKQRLLDREISIEMYKISQRKTNKVDRKFVRRLKYPESDGEILRIVGEWKKEQDAINVTREEALEAVIQKNS